VVVRVPNGVQEGGRKIPWRRWSARSNDGGGPETILLTWLLLLGWGGGVGVCGAWTRRCLNSARRTLPPHAKMSRLKFATALPQPVILLVRAAAAQLLAFPDLTGISQRGQGYADTAGHAVLGLGEFLVPMVFRERLEQGACSSSTASLDVLILSGYRCAVARPAGGVDSARTPSMHAQSAAGVALLLSFGEPHLRLPMGAAPRTQLSMMIIH